MMPKKRQEETICCELAKDMMCIGFARGEN